MLDTGSLQKPERDEVPSHHKPEQNFVSMLVFYVICSALITCTQSKKKYSSYYAESCNELRGPSS